MLAGPIGNRFLFQVENSTSWGLPGTVITPGQNTFPSYVEVMSDSVVTTDCYYVVVAINAGGAAGLNKDTLVNIGADPAGGTSYSTIIPNLFAAGSPSSATSGQLVFHFPLFIKSGTALAAQASVNNATVGTIRVSVRLYGKPTRPELMRCGTYVTTFGADTANSRGTVITPGVSNAEAAAWVQLGSNLTVPHWWWQIGIGCDDAGVLSGVYAVDLAAGTGVSANDMIIENEYFTMNSSETWHQHRMSASNYADVPAGLGIYGRASWHTTPAETNVSLTAHGVGG